MVVELRKYAEIATFLWRFQIYELQREIRVVVWVLEYLLIKILFSIGQMFDSLVIDDYVPGTLAIAMSPRSNALMLFSICRSGAPLPCDSLSGSSSSSIGGAKSRRGVDAKSAELN